MALCAVISNSLGDRPAKVFNPMHIILLGPEGRNNRIQAYLKDRGHRTRITEAPLTLNELEGDDVDLLISNGYAPIIKAPVTTAFAGRIINIHPSYLPYGKGIAGNMWSFLEGTPKGVSIHLIDDTIDTGEILIREEVALTDDETLRSSLDKLMDRLEILFMEIWPKIESGDLSPLSQNTIAESGSYHNRRKSEKVLDLLPDLWDTPTRTVEELGADLGLSNNLWTVCDETIQRNS
jgi:methionyl-tRNA formyltransferase